MLLGLISNESKKHQVTVQGSQLSFTFRQDELIKSS